MEKITKTPEETSAIHAFMRLLQACSMGTWDPSKIREQIQNSKELQKLKELDIDLGIDFDAEACFALSNEFVSFHGPITEENIREYGLTEEEIKGEQGNIDYLRKTIGELTKTVSISYFENNPKGDEFKKYRVLRTRLMKATLNQLKT